MLFDSEFTIRITKVYGYRDLLDYSNNNLTQGVASPPQKKMELVSAFKKKCIQKNLAFLIARCSAAVLVRGASLDPFN